MISIRNSSFLSGGMNAPAIRTMTVVEAIFKLHVIVYRGHCFSN